MRWLIALAVLIWLGCSAPEEQLAEARAAVQAALQRADRREALRAIGELSESAPDTPQSQVELAALLVQAAAAPEAIWRLEAALLRFPADESIRVALAQVALTVGNPSLARQVLEGFPVDSELHPEALLTRARAELELGQLDAGLEWLAEAERRYPDRPDVHLLRIATLLREHRTDEAQAALDSARAALQGDEHTEARSYLDIAVAQIRAAQGEPEAAISSLLELVGETPGSLVAWNALIPLLVTAQRVEEAVALLEAALESQPETAGLHPLLAVVYQQLRRYDDAEGSLRTHLDAGKTPLAYKLLANFHTQRGDTQRAVEMLRESVDQFPDDVMLSMLLIETLLAIERHEEASAQITRLRRTTPSDDPHVEYLAARLSLAQGELETAVSRFRRLLPRLDRPATQFWLAVALEAQRDFAGARRRYSLAAQRDPSWIHPRLSLVRLANRRGDWREMAADALRLTRQAPEMFEGWAALAEAQINLGDAKSAEGNASRLIEAFPDRQEPHLLLIRSLQTQGRYDEAIEKLAAVSQSGVTPRYEAEWAITLGMSGRTEEGIARARKALDSYPDEARLHWALATLLFAIDASKQGAASVDRAMVLNPDDPGPLRTRCEYRVASGQLPGARADCRLYLEHRPDDPGVHFSLAQALAQLGETDEAIATYRRTIELDRRDYRAMNNLAELLSASGDLDGALAAAQSAYRLAEKNPFVLDTVGHLYLQKGFVDRAISLLEDSLAAAPGIPDHALHLALAYREAGRIDDARRLLTSLPRESNANPALRAKIDEVLHSLL